jgi:DNA-directed RNA polymerase sigma subunit (sigma70/sigma32)
VQTLAEIASEFGLTRERVRQIQSQALGKLRVLVERQV